MSHGNEASDPVDLEEAFHAFIAERWDDLVWFAQRLCGSPTRAEDLVQEALMNVTQVMIDGVVHPEGRYAYTKNAIVWVLLAEERKNERRRRKSSGLAGDTVTEDGGPPLLVLVRNDEVEDSTLLSTGLQRCLDGLPTLERVVLVMGILDDVLGKKIAETLGITEVAVSRLKTSGLKRIRPCAEGLR